MPTVVLISAVATVRRCSTPNSLAAAGSDAKDRDRQGRDKLALAVESVFHHVVDEFHQDLDEGLKFSGDAAGRPPCG
jgi:hypothetical protein